MKKRRRGFCSTFLRERHGLEQPVQRLANGVRTSFNNNLTSIGGMVASDRSMVSVFTQDGNEFFVNLDNVTIYGAIIKDGGIWFGDTVSAAITCPN